MPTNEKISEQVSLQLNDEREKIIRQAVDELKFKDEIWRRYKSESETWAEPKNVGSLAHLLAQPRVAEVMLIEGLLGPRHNLSFTAQYKTGKTTAGLNLFQRLVDGEPFLGRETHLPDGARVGWWNGEMDGDEFVHDYAGPVGIRNTQRVEIANLRGERVPLLTPAGRRWAVAWLRDNNIKVWAVDSWRVICAWSGVDENDNTGGGQLLAAIDEIKAEAGVDVFVTLVHTGRGAMDQGAERSRGMTVLDDWVDARWVMTKQHETRFFYARGRRVDMDEVALTFDPETNRIEVGGGNRQQARAQVGNDNVAKIVETQPGIKTGDLKKQLQALTGIANAQTLTDMVSAAEMAGLVHHTAVGQSKLWYLGPDSRTAWANGLPREATN